MRDFSGGIVIVRIALYLIFGEMVGFGQLLEQC